MKKAFLVGIFLFLLQAGCVSRETVVSTHVNPADVYQDYAIFGNQKETKIYAFFRVGGSTGTTIDLEAPSKVESDGKSMARVPPNFMKGLNYTASEEGYKAFHEIIFTASDGKDYRNTIALEAIEFNTEEAIVLRRSQTNFISLTRAISQDSSEKLNLVLSNEDFETQEKKRVKVDLPNTYDTSENALIISSKNLQKMPAGSNAMIIMEVGKSITLPQKTGAGGNLSINYSAKPLKVQIAN